MYYAKDLPGQLRALEMDDQTVGMLASIQWNL